jgi:hypothetical protein
MRSRRREAVTAICRVLPELRLRLLSGCRSLLAALSARRSPRVQVVDKNHSQKLGNSSTWPLIADLEYDS